MQINFTKGVEVRDSPLKFRFLTNLDVCLSACGARFLGLKVYKQQCKIENYSIDVSNLFNVFD